MREFNLTKEHVKLLTNMWVGWCGDEYGAPEIDPKRPYGNSDVERDICKILGWDYGLEDNGEYDQDHLNLLKAKKIHQETQTALQVVLSAKSFQPDVYVRENSYTNKWAKKGT